MNVNQRRNPINICLSLVPLLLIIWAFAAVVPRDAPVSLAQEATPTRLAPAPTRPGDGADRDTPVPPTAPPEPTATPEPSSLSKPGTSETTPTPAPVLMPAAGGDAGANVSLLLAGLACAVAGAGTGVAHRRRHR